MGFSTVCARKMPGKRHKNLIQRDLKGREGFKVSFSLLTRNGDPKKWFLQEQERIKC